MSKKNIIRKNMIPIYIEWRDPTGNDSWTPIEEIQSFLPHTIQTMGYLTHETKDVVVVSLNVDMHEDSGALASCSMIIPKSLIRHMQKIKVVGRCIPKLPKK